MYIYIYKEDLALNKGWYTMKYYQPNNYLSKTNKICEEQLEK